MSQVWETLTYVLLSPELIHLSLIPNKKNSLPVIPYLPKIIFQLSLVSKYPNRASSAGRT